MSKTTGFLSMFLVATALFAPGTCADDTVTVTAVGDIMMGTTWPEELLPPCDGEGMFDNVLESLGGGDIVFGNLEGPLLEGGTGVKCGKRRGRKKSLCFEFRTPVRYVKHLVSAGFNAMNVANNHSGDFGPDGIASTVETLQGAGIQPVGGTYVAAFDVRGKSVAVAGFSYSPPTEHSFPLQDIEGAMELVSELDYEYDLVVVSFHGGAEGKDALRIPDGEEVFAGENRGDVVSFSRSVIDAGADLVIGHGPHVPRAMEVYGGKLVAYSLGNFLTYGRFNLQGNSGISYVLNAEIDAESGNFTGGEIIPVVLLDGGIPSPDPEKQAVRLVRELIEERGMPSGLVVEEDGTICPLPARDPAEKE